MKGLRGTRQEAWIAAGIAAVVIAALVGMLVVTSGGGPTIAPSTPTPPPRAQRPAPKPAPAPPPRLFASDSVWNARVDGDARLAPDSAREIAHLTAESRRAQAAEIGPSITWKKFSTPLYVVPASQPHTRVALDGGQFPGRRELQDAFASVPLPADARPAPGTDGHLTVLQPSTDRLWEFFRFRREGGRPAAAWGGAIEHVSQSPGYYTDRSWPGARHTWGATATSLPVIGGTILISEIQRGEIPHALAFAVPDARAGVWAFPAQRTDGATRDPKTLPEGAHLRLDPSVNIDALHLPPFTAMIAHAAQRYGFILRDRTNRAPGFYVEDPAQFIAQRGYDPVRRAFGSLFPTELFRHFPWSRLQVLDARLCSDRHAPCRPGS